MTWDSFLAGILEINRGVLSAWPVAAVTTFALVQRIKRLCFSKNIDLTLLHVEILAFSVCTINSMLWMHFLFEIPLRQAVIHTWFISTVYVISINYVMAYTKKNQPEIYQALRTKRRQTDFDGDATIPDTPMAHLVEPREPE